MPLIEYLSAHYQIKKNRLLQLKEKRDTRVNVRCWNQNERITDLIERAG
jgi:hypothetical protein